MKRLLKTFLRGALISVMLATGTLVGALLGGGLGFLLCWMTIQDGAGIGVIKTLILQALFGSVFGGVVGFYLGLALLWALQRS